MTPISVGVVGLGKIARDQHLPAIADNPRFQLAATVDRSGARTAMNFNSHGEMLRAADGLEAVAITTPPGPRYAIARDCIDAGLHVLLEKPPTATLAEIDDLRSRAASRVSCSRPGTRICAIVAAAKLLKGRRINGEYVWPRDVDNIGQHGSAGWRLRWSHPASNAFRSLAIWPEVFSCRGELSYPTGGHADRSPDKI